MGLDPLLLEQSFALVAKRRDELATRFYERLFQRYPEVQPMFAQLDMVEQGKKLVGSLGVIVVSLRKPDQLDAYLSSLGVRHGEIGAAPEHYAAVGEKLLAVLQELAGDAWTPEVAQAWTEAYGVVQSAMLRAAVKSSTPRAVAS